MDRARCRNKRQQLTGPTLAIAISTMRRPETLEYNLVAMIDEARELGIHIHISDDSPGDTDTETRVRHLAERYEHIYYHRNAPSLGHDRNIVRTLLCPHADYVWLLADTLQILPGMLRRIMNILNNEDFLFLNAMVSDSDAEKIQPSKPLETIKALLWNQALTGATIYHRRVIQWLSAAPRDIKSNFPQLSIILGYASDHHVEVGWIKYRTMVSAAKTSYWRRNMVIPLWVDDWAALVCGFPKVIDAHDLRVVLRSHAINTGIFKPKNLLHYRAEGQYRWSSIRRKTFFEVVPTPAPLAVAPLLLPPPIASLAIRLASRFFRRFRRA